MCNNKNKKDCTSCSKEDYQSCAKSVCRRHVFRVCDDCNTKAS